MFILPRSRRLAKNTWSFEPSRSCRRRRRPSKSHCARRFHQFDHFRWIVERHPSLESTLVPVIATRTEQVSFKAARARIERWRRIALEPANNAAGRSFLLSKTRLPFPAVVKRDLPIRLVLDEEGG